MVDVDRILRETFVAHAEHHASIGSTNDLAAEMAAAGAGKLPLLIAADRQTAGRGRGAKRWWTGDGALAFSLLVDGPMVGAAYGRSPLVALATAIAVIDAVQPLLPADSLGLHWPNDVMVRDDALAPGRKLAGILIEVLADRRHVIGIGLNSNNTLADAPAELQSTAATLRELTGQTYDQTELLISLLRRLEHDLTQLRREPPSIASRADALCLQRGRMLTLQWDSRSVVGCCRGIAADGAILLETHEGVKSFHAGVVSTSSQECRT